MPNGAELFSAGAVRRRKVLAEVRLLLADQVYGKVRGSRKDPVHAPFLPDVKGDQRRLERHARE